MARLLGALSALVGCDGWLTGGGDDSDLDCTWADEGGVLTLVCQQGGDGSGGSGSDGGAEAGSGGSPVVIPPPANDSCSSPTAIDVAPGEHAFEHGTIAGAVDDVTTFCADPEGREGLPDVVYQMSLSGECALRITLDGATGFDGAVSLRSEACETDEYCTDNVGTQDIFQASIPSGTYWIVVSGHPGSVDDFTLSVQCDAPACGDGLLALVGEACDDGNLTAGDGCDPTCALEPADPSIDTCSGASSGQAIGIDAGQILHLPDGSATTLGATDSGTGSCSLQPDGESIFAAPDHVYFVRPTSSGTLVATIGLGEDDVALCGAAESVEPAFPYPAGCYDRALHVRRGSCDEPASEVACSDNAESWWAREEVSFPVSAGQDYFVFVDGYNDDSYGVGTYVLRLELD